MVQTLQVSSCSCPEELMGMAQSSCSWDSAAAPSLAQPQLSPKTSLPLLLQALRADIKHSQALVTFELLSQCSAFLQVCWGVRQPQPSRDGDIPASGARPCADPPCCLCSELEQGHTDRKQHPPCCAGSAPGINCCRMSTR